MAWTDCEWMLVLLLILALNILSNVYVSIFYYLILLG